MSVGLREDEYLPKKADQLLRAERDSIAFLCLLSRVSLQYDPPIPVDDENEAPTHFAGLNIQACVVDNQDGELLGIGQNAIHSQSSPLEHGEQRALRAAIARVNTKRPRRRDETMEQYYRSSMFMAPGNDLNAFLRSGATCYTTLEPCPMCASTLLVARMKRVVFVLEDKKYGSAWKYLKKHFYEKDESAYEHLDLQRGISRFVDDVHGIRRKLIGKTDKLRKAGTRDTHLLDHCRKHAQRAAKLLLETKESDLVTEGDDRARNSRLLADAKAASNFPHTV
jgi:tRNA(Arg) A34 adenosine deaminase TadA